MSSKRNKRRKMCNDKIKHETKEMAHFHLAALMKKGSGGLISYKCPFCGFWHVGHKTKQRKDYERRAIWIN